MTRRARRAERSQALELVGIGQDQPNGPPLIGHRAARAQQTAPEPAILLADSDGVLDPAVYNDRLLLGLKGTMSEAELHILKSRMHAGRRAKAERGELLFNLPRGYVRRPSGEIALDPDEQVQAVIRLVFALFDRHRQVNEPNVELAS